MEGCLGATRHVATSAILDGMYLNKRSVDRTGPMDSPVPCKHLQGLLKPHGKWVVPSKHLTLHTGSDSAGILELKL